MLVADLSTTEFLLEFHLFTSDKNTTQREGEFDFFNLSASRRYTWNGKEVVIKFTIYQFALFKIFFYKLKEAV